MAQHPNWRIYARDIRTGTMIQELPASSFSFTDELNKAGSFSVTCPLDIAGSSDIDPDVTPAKTCVVFERDGQVLWSGIIWGSQLNIPSNSITFSGAGWLTYWDRVLWEGSWQNMSSLTASGNPVGDGTYPSTTIGMFQYTYSAIGSLWRIVYGETENPARPKNHILPDVDIRDAGTPETADRFVGATKLESLGAILREVSGNGHMDFRFRTYRDYWGDIAVSLDSHWPAGGTDNGVVLNAADNFNLDSVSVAGDAISSAFFTRRGSGKDAFFTGQAQNDVHAEGYVSLAMVVPDAPSTHTNPGLWSQVQYDNFALIRDKFIQPVYELSGSLANHSTPAIGDLTAGEIVEVRAESGYLNLSKDFRITSITTAVADSGAESQQLALVDNVVF